MNKYNTYCTPEQTRRAYKLGAPIEASEEYSNGNVGSKLCVFGEITDKDRWGVGKCVVLHIPTAEQMRNWMRIEKRVIVRPILWLHQITCGSLEGSHVRVIGYFDDYEKAEIEEIDKALEYIESHVDENKDEFIL